MDTSFRLVIGDQILPLDLHAIAADAAGNIVAVPQAGPLGFRFVYRDWAFSGQIIEGSAARIDVSAVIGPLPYTSEAADARAGLRAIIEAANLHLGPRFRIADDGRILLQTSGPIGTPLTTVHFIAAVARLLIPVTAYLECFAVFLVPPGESGETSGRPAWRRRGATTRLLARA